MQNLNLAEQIFLEILNLKIWKKIFEKKMSKKKFFFQKFFSCQKLGFKLRIPLQLFSSYLKTVLRKLLANIEKTLKNDHFWKCMKTARIGRFSPTCADMQFMLYCIWGKNFSTIGKGVHMKISLQTCKLMILYHHCALFLAYCPLWKKISLFLIKNTHPWCKFDESP